MPSYTRLAGLVAAATCVLGFHPNAVTYREVGARNTIDWRVWFEIDRNPISPWHDIPLYPDPDDTSIIYCYTEIPRWTSGKIETKRDEPLNPLIHDEKDGEPRFVYSVWPHKTYPFNYGSIPQTWENVNVDDEETGYPGDNDPVDVFEISDLEPHTIGAIKKVKILGGLAMIDSDTTDWKVMVIDVEDPLADKINDVKDLEKYRPGLADAFHDWFIYYKVIKGDGKNTILGDGYYSSKEMQAVIARSHEHWKDLMSGKEAPGEINRNQTSDADDEDTYVPSWWASLKFHIPLWPRRLPAAAIPDEYQQWYYLDDDFDPIDQ